MRGMQVYTLATNRITFSFLLIVAVMNFKASSSHQTLLASSMESSEAGRFSLKVLGATLTILIITFFVNLAFHDLVLRVVSALIVLTCITMGVSALLKIKSLNDTHENVSQEY